MFRRLFHVSAFLSALCLLCILILWPVSYHREVGADYITSTQICHGIAGLSGRLILMRVENSRAPGIHFRNFNPQDNSLSEWSYSKPPGPRILALDAFDTFGWLGMEHTRAHMPSGFLAPPSEFAIPFSYLAILSSILPTIAFLSRRRKAFRKGLCPRCRYDLRAHAPGANCPECGTVIPAPLLQGGGHSNH